MAFGSSHESAEALSKNAVKILDIGCLDLFSGRISIDHPMNFVDETAILFDLYELSVVDAVLSEELRQDNSVVVIAVRKYLKPVGECCWLDTLGEVSKHPPTG